MKVKHIYHVWFQISNLITQHAGIWNYIHVEYDAYKQNDLHKRLKNIFKKSKMLLCIEEYPDSDK